MQQSQYKMNIKKQHLITQQTSGSDQKKQSNEYTFFQLDQLDDQNLNIQEIRQYLHRLLIENSKLKEKISYQEETINNLKKQNSVLFEICLNIKEEMNYQIEKIIKLNSFYIKQIKQYQKKLHKLQQQMQISSPITSINYCNVQESPLNETQFQELYLKKLVKHQKLIPKQSQPQRIKKKSHQNVLASTISFIKNIKNKPNLVINSNSSTERQKTSP